MDANSQHRKISLYSQIVLGAVDGQMVFSSPIYWKSGGHETLIFSLVISLICWFGVVVPRFPCACHVKLENCDIRILKKKRPVLKLYCFKCTLMSRETDLIGLVLSSGNP